MPQSLYFASAKQVEVLRYSHCRFIGNSTTNISMWKATQHLCRSWMLPKASDLQFSAPLSLYAYIQHVLDNEYLAGS